MWPFQAKQLICVIAFRKNMMRHLIILGSVVMLRGTYIHDSGHKRVDGVSDGEFICFRRDAILLPDPFSIDTKYD